MVCTVRSIRECVRLFTEAQGGHFFAFNVNSAIGLCKLLAKYIRAKTITERSNNGFQIASF